MRKKPGKEDEALLGAEKPEAAGWAASLFGRKKKAEALDTVHVFSLATGALYERMLKIMMLSVRKRTTGPVKFWLFENYLTPA